MELEWTKYNKNITWDIVSKNLNKPWDWYYISQNSNITLNFIKDNLDSEAAHNVKPWDWFGLSCNQNIFKLPDDLKIKHIKEFLAINKIKRAWRLCNSDPNYLVCKKTIIKRIWRVTLKRNKKNISLKY